MGSEHIIFMIEIGISLNTIKIAKRKAEIRLGEKLGGCGTKL